MRIAALVLLAGCDRVLGLSSVHAVADAGPDSAKAAPDAGGLRLVQQLTNQSSNALTLTVTLAQKPVAQDVLVLVGGSSSALKSVTGGGVGTWQLASTSVVSPTDQIWYGVSDGSSDAIKLTGNGSASIWADVTEWDGLETNGTLDVMDSKGNAGGSSSSGTLDLTVTTTHAPELAVFSVAGFGNIGNPSSASAWTQMQITFANPVTQHAWYRVLPDAGALDVKATYTDDYDAVLAAFVVR